MKLPPLPTNDEIVFAISEPPLGEGQEARVFKVHTNPHFTVRQSLELSNDKVFQYLSESHLVKQPDIFGGRNFAQAVAYFRHPSEQPDASPLITINRYVPGFSYEIERSGGMALTSEEALIKTKVMTQKILEVPHRALDILFDDLHFLSARKHTIDVGGGLFCNLGNVLYSANDQRLFIIDLQPFIDTPKVNPNNTKGFNCPYYLSNALLPGLYRYRNEHAKNPDLINMRTEIVDCIIRSAEENKLNDVGCYLRGDESIMGGFWENKLTLLHIPEKYHDNFIKRVTSIKDEQRYRAPKPELMARYQRVSGITD